MDIRMPEKRRSSEEMEDMEEDFHQEQSRSSSPKSNQNHVDQEKRMRREIANSNERRRMQSINAGFQTLKSLIPHQEGEKLSKASILHQAADYITNLEKEKDMLLLESGRLRKRLKEGPLIAVDTGTSLSPHAKRKKRDTESSDEGISMHFDDGSELQDCRQLYLRERQRRMQLDGRVRQLEEQLRQLHHQLAPPSPTSLPPPPPPSSCKDEQMEVESRQESSVPMHSPAPLLGAPRAVAAAAASPPSASGLLRLPTPPQDIPLPQPAAAAAAAAATSALTSPQSKRNLFMIAEAIRHLEGENSPLFDSSTSPSSSASAMLAEESRGSSMFRSSLGPMSGHLHSASGSCEESQTESSQSDDQEDSKSESSGRGSPGPVLPSAPLAYFPTVAASGAQAAASVPVTVSSRSLAAADFASVLPTVGRLEQQTATLHVSAPTVNGVRPLTFAAYVPTTASRPAQSSRLAGY